jgi:uncharacterized membrane protein
LSLNSQKNAFSKLIRFAYTFCLCSWAGVVGNGGAVHVGCGAVWAASLGAYSKGTWRRASDFGRGSCLFEEAEGKAWEKRVGACSSLLFEGVCLQGRTRRQALAEGVTAGVFFGTAAVLIRFVQGLGSFSIVFWAMLPVYAFSAVIVAVLSVPARNPISPFPLVAETALALVGLGLVPTAIAHTLYFSSLSNLKSFETASLALLEPVGATLLGIAAFREVPAPVFAFGAALVLAGIFFVIQNTRR